MAGRHIRDRLYLRKEIKAFPRDLDTQQYLRLLVTILISFIATAVFIYPEDFKLGAYPFSALGRKYTPQGLQNIYARMVFDLGMFLCAYTMYLLARYYRRREPVPDSHRYEFMSYLSAAGFFLMVVPCDVNEVRFLHSIGSGLVVGSHLFMASYRIIAVKHCLHHWVAAILLVTLLVSVLIYAVVWFVQLPYHPLLQKPAFAAIIYVELYGSHLSRYYGERSVWHAAQSERLQ